jgi:hypothetical protein
MLPDIRAVIAAMVAAVGLLLISFALVSTYRIAQQHQAGSLQTDLAKRGQTVPAPSGDRAVPIIETPGPHLTPVETVAATLAEPAPPMAAIETPPAEPPIGGPLAAAPESTRNVAAENPSRIDTRAWQQAAAEKARKARAARIARERKAAAWRAAQARRARQKQTPAFGSNSFGGSFGGTFTPPAGR